MKPGDGIVESCQGRGDERLSHVDMAHDMGEGVKPRLGASARQRRETMPQYRTMGGVYSVGRSEPGDVPRANRTPLGFEV